jgi:signal recognition particle GTPase
MARAQREGVDVLILDTSGRLSNNYELITELQVGNY